MIVRELLNGIINGIRETGNILDPAAVFVGVFSAITDTGVNTVITDLTEPAGTGFVRQPVTTWATPYNMIDGRRVIDAPLKEFRPADETEATVVLGWFLADQLTTGDLLMFGYFPSPIPLPDDNAVVSIVARVTVDPNGRWDATVTFNG